MSRSHSEKGKKGRGGAVDIKPTVPLPDQPSPALQGAVDLTVDREQFLWMKRRMAEQDALVKELLEQLKIKTESTTTPPPTSTKSTASVSNRNLLFRVSQNGAMGDAPKYSRNKRFATWRRDIANFAGKYGLDPLVRNAPAQSWEEAVNENFINLSEPELQSLYLSGGKRLVHAICSAISDAGIDGEQLIADAISGKPDNGATMVGTMKIAARENPYLIMETLRQKYDTKTQYATIGILDQLINLRLDHSKENGTIWFEKIRDLFTQLDRLTADDKPKPGECFGETVKSVITLRLLPTAWDTEIKILTNNERIPLDQVFQLLRRQDDLRNAQKASKSDKISDKANTFVQRKPAGKKQRNSDNNRNDTSHNRPNPQPRHAQRWQNRGSAIQEGDILDCLMKETRDDDQYYPADNDNASASAEEAAFSATYTNEKDMRTIILDSGATRHTWVSSNQMTDVETLDNPIRLITATGKAVTVLKTGTIQVSPTVRMSDVAIVPQAHVNLMSVSRITRAGCRVVFEGHEAYVTSMTNNKVHLKFRMEDGLYVRDMMGSKEPNGKQNRTAGFQIVPANKPPTSEAKQPEQKGPKVNKPTDQPARHIPKRQPDTGKNKATGNPKPADKPPASAPNKPVAIALLRECAYHLAEAKSGNEADPDAAHAAIAAADPITHARFGHQSVYRDTECETCLATRTKRVPITRKPYASATRPLGTLVADLIGPVSALIDGHRQSLPSLGGNSYILVVVDEFTRYSWVRLLRQKGDTAAQVCNLLTHLKRQHSHHPVLRFHSDGGLEFVNRHIDDHLAREGITHTTTTRDKPSHNGKAERFNQTLIALMRSMLHGCSASLSLWGDAAIQGCYVYNRTPLQVIKHKTPHELLYGQPPDLTKIRVFGSNAYYSINENERSKIQPTSSKGVWIGWDERKNGHRILINSDAHIIVSRDVKLVENKFSHLAEIMGFDPQTTGLLGSSPAAFNRSLSAQTGNDTTLTMDSYDEDAGVAPEIPPSTEPPTIDCNIPKSISPAIVQRYNDDDVEPADEEDQSSTDSDGYDPAPGDRDSHSTDPEGHSSDTEDESNDTVGPLAGSSPPLQIPASTAISTRSGRVVQPVVRYGMTAEGDLDIEDQRTLSSGRMLTLPEILPEPLSYHAALKHPDGVFYKQAAAEEIASLAAQEVYELVPQHPSMNVVRSKWVFKVKRDHNNLPIRYKARLVAKGFQQKEGIDYFDTFAPVVKNKSMRIVFALATHYRLCVKQIDFVTAFLNADLDEKIYMHQPEGFEVRDDNGHKLVWHLKKAIYGLKQAPREWNQELDSTLRSLGYIPMVNDPCIYVKRMDGQPPIILSVYVDDTLAAYHPALEEQWNADKNAISKLYPITDIGDCEWVLNMKVNQSTDRSAITLSQRAYIERILGQYNMLDSKPLYTPAQLLDLTDPKLPPGEPLSTAQHELYRKIIGSALYAANTTRVDIAYTVGMLARFVCAPTTVHLQAAKHLLRYLRGTMDHCLKFEDNGTNHLQITAYADSDWSGDKSDRKSTTGYIVQLNGNTVCWQSKKQHTVALSSTEAEYMALSAATSEVRWTLMLLQEMIQLTAPVDLFCDNQSAVAIVRSDKYSERTKHIDTRHHFIKQFIRDGSINLQWISTEDQLADLLTKTLGRVRHTDLTNRLLATTTG